MGLTGNLDEVLATVHVEPECIEILANKEIQEYSLQEIEWLTEVFPRKTLIEEKELPVKIRSYFFEFNINYLRTKVYGDLQYQISDWD